MGHKKYSVRNAFYKMIFNVMTNMMERYDYKTLLLSYVLSGLQDESKDIQTMRFDAIEKIGKMHEKDEYNDLKKTLFYQQQAEEITKLHFCGDDKEEFVLPFPFKNRPCLGSRLLIREHFSRIINAALSELKDWKNDCREMAILLVRNMIIYSEEYCTQNAEISLVSLHQCVNDKNVVLSAVSKQCCSLIGKYVYPIVWIDYLCDVMCNEFDIEWIIVLQQLIMYCPLKRLSEITKQIIVLMEFALSSITKSDKMEMSVCFEDILSKVSMALQKYKNDDGPLENQDVDFEFSSEYIGFHLEIIDETLDNASCTDKSSQTLQERIDAILQTTKK